MRLPTLFLVLALCIATDLAYRQFWYLGVATPDPPLLFVFWLSLMDRRARVHLVLAVLSLLRSWGGLEGVLASWLPMALVAELILLTRRGLFLREPGVRLTALAAAMFLFLTLDGWLNGRELQEILAWAAVGVLPAALSATILFPILDGVAPLLRSYRYPL